MVKVCHLEFPVIGHTVLSQARTSQSAAHGSDHVRSIKASRYEQNHLNSLFAF